MTKHFLACSAACALLAAAALPASATLQIEVFDNGLLIDNITGVTTGAASLTTNDANFANITINAQGSPILPKADLSSVTFDATTSSSFSGTHTLTVDAIQTDITGTGNTLSTFTVNGLINDPGPTTESTFADGALLASHTFPVALLDGAFGPVSAATGAFTSDETQFAINFSLALFLTAFVMGPAFERAYDLGVKPLVNNEITAEQAFERASDPFRAFMLKNVREKDLKLFVDMAREGTPAKPEDLSLRVLVPAFMISELKRAFEIGFLLFLPFLVIDLVVASVLMSMGMMMLPPVVVSLPFKLIFFVLVDGWSLVAGSLVQSYGQ